jgi:glycosyltransferase involved in cell wall biosynthesis
MNRSGEPPSRASRSWRATSDEHPARRDRAVRVRLHREDTPAVSPAGAAGQEATTRALVRAEGLRLALVSDTWGPQVNGVTRTLERLAQTVRDRGGAVEVFTTSDPGASEEAGVHRADSLPLWLYPQLRVAPPRPRPLIRAMRAWGATLVHAATPFGMGVGGRAAARALGLPLVTSYHTHFGAYLPHYALGAATGMLERYLRWFHNGGRRTYCPTQAVARELEGRGFANAAVWGRGVDADRFSPAWRTGAIRQLHGGRDNELLVAYVGRVAREKGIDELLDAMQLLHALPDAPPCRLLVVGDGPHLAACRAREVPRVTFTGRASGETLARLYASADLFVFPSTTDTFGNVTLEAMASGLPVVAAECAVTRELLPAGAGSFYAAGDTRALAAHIARWGRDPALRIAAGRNGREAALGRSWARVFDDLLTDYSAVLADRGAIP